jgi:diguanylate cyclase (GGDEF)-like protein/PAS domain S-box-containing protein
LTAKDLVEHVADSLLRVDTELLRHILDAIPLPVFIKDERLHFFAVNSSMCELMGHPYESLIGKCDFDFVPAEYAEVFRAVDRLVLETGQTNENEEEINGPDGSVRTLVTRKKLASLANGTRFVVGTITDVSELKRREESSRMLFNSSRLPMWVYDSQTYQFLAVNQAAIDHYGYSRDHFLSMSVLDIVHESDIDAFGEASNDEDFGSERIWTHTKADGNLIEIAAFCQQIAFKETAACMVSVVDVTERQRAIERIEHLARHDVLTGLPNRQAFAERLDLALDRASATSAEFAVLCLDLDRFKDVNDIFGHAAGDALLREFGRRIVRVAEGAFIGRMGGDEFTMIVEGPQPETAVDLVRRMMDIVAGEFEYEGHRFRCGLSTGIAIFPRDGREAKTLLSNADAALYRAKADGRGVYRVFEADMDKRLRERRALQNDLHTALAGNQLSIHYQPQALMTGVIIGFEALVRWQHPKMGPISPSAFIPLAEENGLIVSFGEWILREACREAATWPNPVQIAVNLSPIQFRHGDLPQMVHQILLETSLAPARLELEITESVLFDDFARASSVLRRLKALGVRIALDDFGTGYSSLSYLQSFPFDKIKIDRSFISRLREPPQSAAIIRAIIGLGHGLSMNIVAEGVETSDQFNFLCCEECDEVQGYFIGRPLPISEYADQVGRPSKAMRSSVRM